MDNARAEIINAAAAFPVSSFSAFPLATQTRRKNDKRRCPYVVRNLPSLGAREKVYRNLEAARIVLASTEIRGATRDVEGGVYRLFPSATVKTDSPCTFNESENKISAPQVSYSRRGGQGEGGRSGVRASICFYFLLKGRAPRVYADKRARPAS